MTRLQKKCFVAAAGTHLMLLVVVLAASAIHSKPELTEDQVLDVVSTRLWDLPSSGGGQVSPVTPQPTRVPSTPSAPALPSPRIVPRSHPPSHEAAATPNDTPSKSSKTKPPTEKTPTGSAPSRRGHTVEPTFSETTTFGGKNNPKHSDTPDSTSSGSASAKAKLAEFAKATEQEASAVRAIGAAPTVVTLPGESSGEAFVSYDEYIVGVYKSVWSPQVMSERSPSTVATIVVSRDGTVNSADITKKSGDSSFDRSVQRALDGVPRLHPFPPGVTDEKRSFSITFKPEPKLSSG